MATRMFLVQFRASNTRNTSMPASAASFTKARTTLSG